MEEFVVYGKVECEYELLEENEQVNMGNAYMEDDYYFKEANGYKKNRLLYYAWIDETWNLFSDLKFVYKQIGTSIQEINKSHFSIFPNPTSDYIQLTWEGSNNANVNIYNAFGQVIKHELINNNSKIEVSDLPKGLYYVQLSSKEKLLGTQSIIIQ